MAPPRRLALPAALAAALSVVTASSYCQHNESASKLMTAPGVEYRMLLNGLSDPRGLVADAEGNLLVVERGDGGKGVTRVVLDDGHGTHVCVESKTRLVPDSKLNHGIALSRDGKTLFASSSSDVYAWEYDAVRGKLGSRRHIITGMKQGGHATRTLLIPERNPNLLLVSRGSDGNVDKGTTDIESARSQIRVFKLDELLHARYPVQYSSASVLGWGLRNSVGVAQDPSTGNIWSVENSLDGMKRGGRDIHQSNPGEELNFHGRPDDTYNDVYGKNFGYPACVAIYDESNVGHYPGGAETGKQMVGDHMPKNWTDGYCREETVAPRITFESHLAPLDLEFQDDGAAVYISMHGSWNRQPGAGYRLSRVSFSDGFPVHEANSRDAEEKVMWNADESLCPFGCFRPVGLELSPGSDLAHIAMRIPAVAPPFSHCLDLGAVQLSPELRHRRRPLRPGRIRRGILLDVEGEEGVFGCRKGRKGLPEPCHAEAGVQNLDVQVPHLPLGRKRVGCEGEEARPLPNVNGLVTGHDAAGEEGAL